MICSIDGCDKKVAGRGWCAMHYRRWLIYGDTSRGALTPEERFLAKVDKSSSTDGCWLWLGALDKDGYGKFSVSDAGVVTRWRAHRWIWAQANGAIPDDLVVNHLCHSPECPGGRSCIHRRCVNVTHMELTTPRGNLIHGRVGDTVTGVKDTCANGHSLTGEGAMLVFKNGRRRCRECNRAAYRRWEARKAQEVIAP